jgi:hypothetical protein
MPQNDKDRVRLLISDVGGGDGESFLFLNEEILTFLEMNEGNVRLAAAEALRSIAGNEAQVSKRIKFLELSTDGPSVAKELRALADKFEEAADDEGDIEIASMSPDPFESFSVESERP